jgi:hypothetical protein
LWEVCKLYSSGELRGCVKLKYRVVKEDNGFIYYETLSGIGFVASKNAYFKLVEKKQMEWISVEDRLPNIGETCLLYITYPKGTMFNCRADPLDRTNVEIGGRIHNGKFTSLLTQFSGKEIEHVSHWMPLPKPPEKT